MSDETYHLCKAVLISIELELKKTLMGLENNRRLEKDYGNSVDQHSKA